MIRHHTNSTKASVLLVALCFVTVLGISLASYVAVCSRTMQVSDRTFQTDLSRQLAEMGLEEALRAFNKNDWNDWTNGTAVDWTLDASNKRATATITFPAGKFGQGLTGSVKIRVDNYDAKFLAAPVWGSSKTYQFNETVSDNGVWYRCLLTHSSSSANRPPNLGFWAEAPIPWMWSSDRTYSQYDLVNYGGNWYRYYSGTATSGTLPTNTTRWNVIPSISLSWSTGKSYPLGAIVFHSGVWYFCYSAHTSSTAPDSDSAHWVALTAPGTNTWNSAITYAAGDYVYQGGWYRCIQANTNIAPPNATYWSTTDRFPYISWAYRSAATYDFNDVVFYSTSGPGTWYRREVSSTTTNQAPTSTSYWQPALGGDNTTTSPGVHGWSSQSVAYQPGDCVYYYASSTSQWFRCIKEHTSSASIPPTDTTYWDSTLPYSSTWDPGRQYGPNDLVCHKGIWYKSNSTNTGSVPPDPPATGPDWIAAASSTDGYFAWDNDTPYSAGTYQIYGGVWYRCIASTTANAGQSPNNSTYWTASWAQSSGVTTGAPVIYAEGAINIAGGGTIKSQLRATIAPAPLFPNAAGSTTTISIGSSGGTVDSYDGSVRAIDTAGTYDTFDYDDQTNLPYTASSANIGYSAVLAAGSNASSAITISNTTTVKGYLALPTPGAGISSNTTVSGPNSPVSPKVDNSRVSRSPYVPKFDILQTSANTYNYLRGRALPSSTPAWAYTINLGTPGAVTPTLYYYNGDLTIGRDSDDIRTINIDGPVILNINGYLRIRAGSTLGGVVKISSSGSLLLRCTYLRAYSGSHGIYNRTLDPKRLTVIADNNSTTTTAAYLDHGSSATNTDFYGALYVPNTTATLGMEVRTGVKVYGAISANEITFPAEANLHYDSSLRFAPTRGVEQPYAIIDWRELDSTERATMP